MKVTGKVTSVPPMGCGAKSTEVGAIVNDAVAVSPWPLKSNVGVAPASNSPSACRDSHQGQLA